MAEVYKAIDVRLGREVAIKFLSPTAEDGDVSRQRFKLEVRSLARLSHPNIVSVLGYGEYEGRPYLVMEYVPGGTLKDKLGKPMRWETALALLAPIARALHYAHGKKIVHRDVKPSNILITEDGRPMLSDFGVAKLIGSEKTTALTATDMGIGTPHYMSPEQGRNQEIGPKSDVYSLGVVLYEMVTGKKPFQADTPIAILLKHIEDPIPNPRQVVKDLPEKIRRIILRALAKDPRGRFRDMAEMASALEGKSSKPSEAKRNTSLLYGLPALGVGLVLLFYLVPLVRGAFVATPTETTLPDGFALVTELRGEVVYTPAGTINWQPLSPGDHFEAGQGATVEVVGEGYVELSLTDGSALTLGDETKIELAQISSDTDAETIVTLIRGQLLVNASIPEDRDLLVQATNGAIARVEGTIMGVFFGAGGQHFQVDCLEGHCVVLDTNGNAVNLSAGQYAEIFGLEDVSDIQTARYEFWHGLADLDLLFTPTAVLAGVSTETPVSTPTSRPAQVAPASTLQSAGDQGPPDSPTSVPVSAIYGCTDASGAQNYNPNATHDDGSCVAHILGCRDANAQNYNPSATKDNGSCAPHILGCMDPNAQNYNPSATKDNGSCVPHILGCMDPNAQNYNPSATKDDGSCTY
ncbi:MAG: protein kinase [Anaerolineales bacterium]|nr:protein kinase [Anaerolineales bacterium]